jgi:hypothetical protein
LVCGLAAFSQEGDRAHIPQGISPSVLDLCQFIANDDDDALTPTAERATPALRQESGELTKPPAKESRYQRNARGEHDGSNRL